MKLEPKYLIAVIIVLCTVIIRQHSKAKTQARLFTELVGTETEFKKLKNENALLANKYKSQVELNQETLNKFHEVTGQLNERIKVLSNVTYKIDEKARETGNSDVKFVTKSGQSFLLNEIKFNDGPAVGYVLIFSDGRMVSKMYTHEISVDQVVTRDETTGKYKVLAHADYVLKSPSLNKDWYNKPYRLKVKAGEAIIDPTEPNYASKKSFMWAPRINMNLLASPQITPGLSLSLAGYGVSRNDLQYKFLDLGMTYDQRKDAINPTLMPVLFRPLPNLLPNTYLGPGITANNFTEIKYFGGLQVGF